MDMLHKLYEFKDTSVDEKSGTIKGYASTFGNIDRHLDKMEQGCFKKSLKQTKGVYPVMLNHKDQIGMNKFAKEDEKGLYVESVIFKDEPELIKSKEAWALIKKALEMGCKMGLSIGGLPKEYSYDRKQGGYIIREFDLIEHSVTPIPANPKAQIVSMKSFTENSEDYKKNYDELNRKLEEQEKIIMNLYQEQIDLIELIKTKI